MTIQELERLGVSWERVVHRAIGMFLTGKPHFILADRREWECVARWAFMEILQRPIDTKGKNSDPGRIAKYLTQATTWEISDELDRRRAGKRGGKDELFWDDPRLAMEERGAHH